MNAGRVSGEHSAGRPAGNDAAAPALAYVGMGANLGNCRATLIQAAAEIAALPGTLSTRLSPLYRSAPVDAGGPDYLNAVLALETTTGAEALLRALLDIENRHGRQRPYHNAPRSLDLDLLLHGGRTLETAFLTLPHPRMHERAFVLKPLRDLAPDLALPQGSLHALLAACGGQRLERLADA
ncbi:2-amino-4-hydroxy-6-hydroxymethyldihydropteridine diphosphokinase [Alcaligenaceae bacterium]|nr:2-amino-4-hydroxy-6-hydroxymethyldihydropteridine diphosphokinase [Alcaligenaceae bacterium]